jgi:hypothetical protein
MTPEDKLRARVLAAVADEPSPPRGGQLVRSLVFIGGIIGLSLAVFRLKGGFDLFQGDRPPAFVLGTAAGWLVVAALSLWIAFGHQRSMLGLPRSWLVGAAVIAPAVLVLWTLAWAFLFPEAVHACPPNISPIGARCRDLTLAVSAVPLLAVLLARRQTDPVHPAATGAALGVALGSLVGVAVDVQCGCAATQHVLFGHVLPVVGIAAAGAVGGNWLLAVRARR